MKRFPILSISFSMLFLLVFAVSAYADPSGTMQYGLICGCGSIGAALGDVTIPTTKENMKQVQRVVFMRVWNGTSKNSIPVGSGAGGIELEATWTTLKAASDHTKAVPSPFIQNPETEPGAVREFGGGNATLGGIPIALGSEATAFSALIMEAPQLTISELKAMACENIGVFLINECGQIAGLTDDMTTPTVVYPIPVQGFFVGDKKLGGYAEPDSNAISWKFFPNWSDMFHVVTPSDFNGLDL